MPTSVCFAAASAREVFQLFLMQLAANCATHTHTYTDTQAEI